jgi:branched-chain amino acid transport system substrate-binding protein
LKRKARVVVGVGAHNFRAADLTDSVLRAKGAAPDVWINTWLRAGRQPAAAHDARTGLQAGAILLVGTGDTFETLESLGAEYPRA